MLYYSSNRNRAHARVVELVDSLDSGSSVHSGRGGSSPPSRTKKEMTAYRRSFFFLYPGDLNPRALSKPPGEACNPRRPAPQRRSNPALPATSKQHHEVIGRRRRRPIDRWCCFFQLRLYISRHQCHNRIRFFTYTGKCKVLVNPFLCFWWSCTIIVPQNWRVVSGFAIFLKVRCDL